MGYYNHVTQTNVFLPHFGNFRGRCVGSDMLFDKRNHGKQ